MWVEEEVTESQPRAEQAALFPLRPLPHIQHHNAVVWVVPPYLLICMTHGYELRWGCSDGRGVTGQRRIKGRKNGTTIIA